MSIKLFKNKNNFYTLKFRISTKLIVYFNKKVISKSLHTKDIKQAKLKSDKIYYKYKEILGVVGVLSQQQIQQLVDKYIIEQLDQDLQLRASDGVGIVFAPSNDYLFKDDATASNELIASLVSEYREELANSDISSIEATGSVLLSNIGIEYDKTNSSHRAFMLQLLQGQINLFSEVAERYSGKIKIHTPFVTTQPNTPTVVNDNIITLGEVFIRFTKHYKQTGVKIKSYNDTVSKLERTILPYFGLDKDVKSITPECIDEFKEFLQSFPHLSKSPYNKMTFEDINKLRTVPQEHLITSQTQVRYLKTLKQIFNFMIKSNIINYNPTTLLIMPDDTAQSREPFTKDDIINLFAEFEKLDNRKFIYYILAYTGMRPNELWHSSIKSEDDILYFDLISADLKTDYSKRKIPLHKDLVNMGIDKLLPQLQQNFKQETLSRQFNQIIKPKITDNPNKIMYSFRHTIATNLKRLGINMDIVSEILGHSYTNSSMTKEVYASGYTLQQLKDAIDTLEL